MERSTATTRVSLSEFAAIYHPQLTALHISMGPENVTNLYAGCTHWLLFERQLLGDLVPFQQRAPQPEHDAACEDIVLTYLHHMDECLAHFISAAGDTPQSRAVRCLHQEWSARAQADAMGVVRELRDLVETELTFMPGYAASTKGESLVDDLIRSCIAVNREASLLPDVPPVTEKTWHWIAEEPPSSPAPQRGRLRKLSEQRPVRLILDYPSFGGGGNPHEVIHSP